MEPSSSIPHTQKGGPLLLILFSKGNVQYTDGIPSFMAEEVLEGIFRIELPLPRNPLRSINSYLIIGEKRNLIVDTGMNRSECLEVLDHELSMLDIDLSITDVFVTHLHADHLGLAPHLSKGRTKVFMGKEDVGAIKESDYWSKMHSFAVMNGFPDLDPEDSIKKHPGYKYGPLGPMDLHEVLGGEDFHIGPYDLKAVHTPGHTDGHMCLYDMKNKVLFSGDHILGDITPNISLWDGKGDPLSDYMSSLELLRDLDVKITLPGHRSTISDHAKRIDELMRHHLQRADEVLNIMGEGSMTGFQIASQMTWDLTIKKFEDFPIMQKWFALGEALAHIRFLQHEGRISREMSNGICNYSII